MMVRWRTYSFKVDGEQREQESLDGEEDKEKEKTTRRRRNIPRYGGEGEEAETCDDARVRRKRCSSLDKTILRWRTDNFKVNGQQREQESLDGEEDREKDKTTRRRRNIPRYGGEVGGQAVLGRQDSLTTPWLTERHGYDPTLVGTEP